MNGNYYVPLDKRKFSGKVSMSLTLEYFVLIKKFQVQGEKSDYVITPINMVIGRELKPNDEINWVEMNFVQVAQKPERLKISNALTEEYLGYLFGDKAREYARQFVRGLTNNKGEDLNLRFEPYKVFIDRAKIVVDKGGDILRVDARVRSHNFAEDIELRSQQ